MLIKNIYVVYLTEYLGEKLPRFYIGSSSKENILKGYNGSIKSKKYKDIYKQEQLNNKHLFKTEILFECYDREVALDIEYKFQKLVNAVERDDYMNMSYAGGCFGKQNLTTPESIKKGLETKRKNGNNMMSEETKQKISNANKGRKFSLAVRQKISQCQKGKKQPESHKQKTRDRMIGNILSEETKHKISLSNSKYYNVYDNNHNLILENISVHSDEYKKFNFPPTFQDTARKNKTMYEGKISNIRKSFIQYKGYYMREYKEIK